MNRYQTIEQKTSNSIDNVSALLKRCNYPDSQIMAVIGRVRENQLYKTSDILLAIAETERDNVQTSTRRIHNPPI